MKQLTIKFIYIIILMLKIISCYVTKFIESFLESYIIWT